MQDLSFSPELLALADKAENKARQRFAAIDAVSQQCTARVMAAFARHPGDLVLPQRCQCSATSWRFRLESATVSAATVTPSRCGRPATASADAADAKNGHMGAAQRVDAGVPSWAACAVY